MSKDTVLPVGQAVTVTSGYRREAHATITTVVERRRGPRTRRPRYDYLLTGEDGASLGWYSDDEVAALTDAEQENA